MKQEFHLVCTVCVCVCVCVCVTHKGDNENADITADALQRYHLYYQYFQMFTLQYSQSPNDYHREGTSGRGGEYWW